MISHEEIRPMLTVKDVARLLHIHENTARRWSDQGIIKSYRITRRGDRRFRREDILRYLAEFNDSSIEEDNQNRINSAENISGNPKKSS